MAVVVYLGLQLGRLGIPPHVAYGLCLLQEPLGLTQGIQGAQVDARDLVSPIGTDNWLKTVELYLGVQSFVSFFVNWHSMLERDFFSLLRCPLLPQGLPERGRFATLSCLACGFLIRHYVAQVFVLEQVGLYSLFYYTTLFRFEYISNFLLVIFRHHGYK